MGLRFGTRSSMPAAGLTFSLAVVQRLAQDRGDALDAGLGQPCQADPYSGQVRPRRTGGSESAQHLGPVAVLGWPG
jgi:hypothetical protein